MEIVTVVLLDLEDLLGWGPQLLDERIVCHSVVHSLRFCFLASFGSEIVLLLLDGFVADEEHGLLCQLVEFEFHDETFLVFALRHRHQLGSLHRLILELQFDYFGDLLVLFESLSVPLLEAFRVKTCYFLIDIFILSFNCGLNLINLALYCFDGAIRCLSFVNILRFVVVILLNDQEFLYFLPALVSEDGHGKFQFA